MVDALVAALPSSGLHLLEAVSSLDRMNDHWQLTTSGGKQNFDAVFLAVPAPSAAALLSDTVPRAAAHLQRIPYTSSAAVLLACEQSQLPAGFGFLVPASEGRKMLACTFVHKKFSDRSPEQAALLRCFFSSARVPQLLQYSEEELTTFAREELRKILGIDLQPLFSCVFRWHQGLPQYEIGHLDRTAEIEAQLGELPGLHVIGNSLHGIGVPDCIRSARQAVNSLLQRSS
jgi:oxygen-dependent protoporphyrinogen oxidase